MIRGKLGLQGESAVCRVDFKAVVRALSHLLGVVNFDLLAVGKIKDGLWFSVD